MGSKNGKWFTIWFKTGNGLKPSSVFYERPLIKKNENIRDFKASFCGYIIYLFVILWYIDVIPWPRHYLELGSGALFNFINSISWWDLKRSMMSDKVTNPFVRSLLRYDNIYWGQFCRTFDSFIFVYLGILIVQQMHGSQHSTYYFLPVNAVSLWVKMPVRDQTEYIE